MKGTVAGTLDVDATVAHVSSGVTPDSVQADGKVDAGAVDDRRPRDHSRVARRRPTTNPTGDIRTLEIAGRDVNVQASGTLALNETGQSNLKVHADSPSLEEIGKLVDQPITGIGKIDATVTGNKRELKAAGNARRRRREVRRQRRAHGLEHFHRDGAGSDGRGRERGRRHARAPS